MSRKFITGVLIVAATITALATAPARAGDRDQLRKVIIGATVFYLTARMIDELSRQGVRIDGQRHSYDYDRGRRHDWDKPRHRRVLPGSCVRKIEIRDKSRRVMPYRCLKRNNVRVHRLPDRCEINWRGRNGMRTGYKVRCLKRQGYEIAQRW
ncbi:hypothetical protein [Pacificoceanicola onchidii]|uniref:hypothetical protein n=1 Tax=Pacificoceanicola onchidii TaxID=2562685 RepID=UPI0010A48E65|nr:hypothetical protein [Pacificoceanicola onchidii]